MDKKEMITQMMNDKVAEVYGITMKDRVGPSDIARLPASQFERENDIDHEIYMARFRTVVIRVTVHKAGNYVVDIVL